MALDGDDVTHARGFRVPGERDRVRPLGGAGGARPRPSVPGGPAAPGVRSPIDLRADGEEPRRAPEAKPLRLFVALEIPEAAKDVVEAAFAPWREEFPKAR